MMRLFPLVPLPHPDFGDAPCSARCRPAAHRTNEIVRGDAGVAVDLSGTVPRVRPDGDGGIRCFDFGALLIERMKTPEQPSLGLEPGQLGKMLLQDRVDIARTNSCVVPLGDCTNRSGVLLI